MSDDASMSDSQSSSELNNRDVNSPEPSIEIVIKDEPMLSRSSSCSRNNVSSGDEEQSHRCSASSAKNSTNRTFKASTTAIVDERLFSSNQTNPRGCKIDCSTMTSKATDHQATAPPDRDDLTNSMYLFPLRFPCPYCGVRFSNENTLKAHLLGYCSKINHEVNAVQQNMSAFMNISDNNRMSSGETVCSQTDNELNSKTFSTGRRSRTKSNTSRGEVQYQQSFVQDSTSNARGELIQNRQLTISGARQLDVPPVAVILEAVYHPERLEASKCFRAGDICYIAVRLDMPTVLSPSPPPTTFVDEINKNSTANNISSDEYRSKTELYGHPSHFNQHNQSFPDILDLSEKHLRWKSNGNDQYKLDSTSKCCSTYSISQVNNDVVDGECSSGGGGKLRHTHLVDEPLDLSVTKCAKTGYGKRVPPLKKDIRRNSSEKSEQHQCSVCGYLAATGRGLRLHSRVHNNTSSNQNNPHSSVNKSEQHLNNPRRRASTNGSSRGGRKRSHSSGQSSSLDDDGPKQQSSPFPLKPAAAYGCQVCGVQFSSPTTLNQHRLYYCQKQWEQQEMMPQMASCSPSGFASAELASLIHHRSLLESTIVRDLGVQQHQPHTPLTSMDGSRRNRTSASSIAIKSLSNAGGSRKCSRSSVSLSSDGIQDNLQQQTVQMTDNEMNNANHCDHCNINFIQKSSYIAHKLHYCKGPQSLSKTEMSSKREEIVPTKATAATANPSNMCPTPSA